MSTNPKISVVMGVHNDSRYLNDAVSSVLRQEGVDLEFIVVNDGSTDGSGDLLDEYASKDSRIRVVHQENRGLTAALIAGCSLTRGEYIARQDADDISFPLRLQTLSAELDEHQAVVMVSSTTVMIGPGNELLLDRRSELSASPKDTSCHGSLMFRRDAYERAGGYRLQFRAAQDIDLRCRLEEAGETRVLQRILYAYRVDDTSISARSPIQKELSKLAESASHARKNGLDERAIIEAAERLSSNPPLRKRSQPGAGNYFIGRCLTTQRDRRALRYLWQACRNDLLSARAWLALAHAALVTRMQAGHDITLSGIFPRQRRTRDIVSPCGS